MSLDGVIDAPIWTAEYGFDPGMGEAIGAVTDRSKGILLGRATYEMVPPHLYPQGGGGGGGPHRGVQ
jgi:hypothetical protein